MRFLVGLPKVCAVPEHQCTQNNGQGVLKSWLGKFNERLFPVSSYRPPCAVKNRLNASENLIETPDADSYVQSPMTRGSTVASTSLVHESPGFLTDDGRKFRH